MKVLVIALILGHFTLDWILQPREMARSKSSNPKALSVHLLINFIGLLLITGLFSDLPFSELILLNLANIITHGLIDWHIWPLSHKIRNRYKNQDKREYVFYSTIAVDQALHLIILMLLFI